MLNDLVALLHAKLAEHSAKKAYDDAVEQSAKAEKAWLGDSCADDADSCNDYIGALQREGFTRMQYVQAKALAGAVFAGIKGEATPGCNCERCLRVRGHAA